MASLELLDGTGPIFRAVDKQHRVRTTSLSDRGGADRIVQRCAA
jgi:hypothetical protein